MSNSIAAYRKILYLAISNHKLSTKLFISVVYDEIISFMLFITLIFVT